MKTNVNFWLPATIVMVALSAIWLFPSCNTPPKPEEVKERPNIIFIMADDLGYGDLGCYGQQVLKTPELDQMAKEGIRFTDCYTGSPVCAPSRSVLMTGQHTGHTTVRGNFGKGGVTGLGGGKGRIPLNANDTTIAQVLKNAGYTTGMIGKWGLGEPNTSGTPKKQGFDYFYGFINQRRAHTYYPDYIWRNNKKIILEGNQNGAKNDYIHDHFTQESIDFIKKNKDNPFFLYLPYTVPHDEYEIPDLGRFANYTNWTDDEKVYAAMVERLSKDVGKILQTLKDVNIDENTVVFFCSDNGAASRWTGRFDSSGPLKGRKRDLYEGGLRTPMIIRYPGTIPANKVSSYPWYFPDVMPTLAQFANTPSPISSDGIDISDVIFGGQKEVRNAPMYWEFYEGGYRQAIRWKNWKGVRPSRDSDWEIYDLSNDIGELHNIAESNIELVTKMKTIAESSHSVSPYFDVDGEY